MEVGDQIIDNAEDISWGYIDRSLKIQNSKFIGMYTFRYKIHIKTIDPRIFFQVSDQGIPIIANICIYNVFRICIETSPERGK